MAPSIVAQLKEVFLDLRRSTALMIVEQNLPLVCAISDKVYALRVGRIVAELTEPSALTPSECERYV